MATLRIKNNKKAIAHTVNVNGQTKEIKTTCKTFGQGLLDKNFAPVGKCKTCAKQRPEIYEGCMVKTAPDIEPAKKTSGHGVGVYPKFKKVWANGQPRGAMRRFIAGLVERGEYNRADVIRMVKAAYPDSRPATAGLYIGHGMKGTGKDAKRFDYRIVADKKGRLHFDKKQPKGTWGQV